MGRYSYSQPSSSSRRLWSNGEAEVSPTPLCRSMSFGIPNRCYCVKWWDEAVMEEFQELRCALDNQGDSIRILQNGDGQEAHNRIEAELAQLKELIVDKKHLRCLELR
ncbi:unnamed protein product, partial [Thlaspi arvense]